MMTPEQVAAKVKMDRAQRERDHGHAPVETITSIRRQIWGY